VPSLRMDHDCAPSGQVFYCDQGCQRGHWKQHKALCTGKLKQTPKSDTGTFPAGTREPAREPVQSGDKLGKPIADAPAGTPSVRIGRTVAVQCPKTFAR
jgi:hypothetical protein